MDDANSGDRAHKETGCDAPTSAATAVPHEPAPTTATRSRHPVSLRRSPRGGTARRTYTVPQCPPAPLPDPQAPPTSPRATLGQEVVLIPVKGFRHAKRRLGGSMTDEMREHLVRSMAAERRGRVRPAPRRRRLRRSRGGGVGRGPRSHRHVGARTRAQRRGPGRGGTAGRRRRALGDRRPRRSSARPRSREPGSVRRHHARARPQGRRDERAAPARRLRLPLRLRSRAPFAPHRAEAARLGLPVRILRIPALAYDVDWPADVVELTR